jgi:hypothetical protein
MVAKIVLIVLSVICFLALVFGVVIGSVNLLALGLAFLAASFLPWRE